jgi:hypothetical protein
MAGEPKYNKEIEPFIIIWPRNVAPGKELPQKATGPNHASEMVLFLSATPLTCPECDSKGPSSALGGCHNVLGSPPR